MCKFTAGRRDDEPTAGQKYGEALLELCLYSGPSYARSTALIVAMIVAMDSWWADMSEQERRDAHAFNDWLSKRRT